MTQRSPTPRAVHRRGQGTGLGIPRKEKKEEVTSPLKWEGTHLSKMDAAAWAASGQRRRMKDGSGRVESMLNFDQFRKRSHG